MPIPFDEVMWEGLRPPYRTIVVDPPWRYDAAWHGNGPRPGDRRITLPYSTMSTQDIAALPMRGLAQSDAHLFLWTTSRFLRPAFGVLDSWGFRYSQLLTWCKRPRGIGPGGAFSTSTEHILFARLGKPAVRARADSTWWQWPRGAHSAKPAAFYDLVERVCPGPYVELFARQPRFGWDSWGWGYEELAVTP